ncbi:MAG: hypothetical protein JWR77_1575 [Rhizorhabdus sp.]|nr:hypothetical protein [Rhizorhabdus sp.]
MIEGLKALLAFAAASLPAYAIAAERVIEGVYNAEDLAPLEGGRWVLASSMAGGQRPSGSILAIDVRTGKASTLYPNADKAAAPAPPGCPGPVAADAFKPHGIALHKNRLYVVNHGGRESIEIFDVDQTKEPKLRWVGCAVFPAGGFGNGVALTADGTLYATNMGLPMDGSKAVSPMGGDVLSWSATQGWHTVPDSQMFGPNGLLVTPDGSKLYVAAWPAGELVELSLTEAGTTRRTLKLPFLPDNVRWSKTGAILVAGHRTSPETVAECYMSTRAQCEIPSTIAEIDPASLTISCQRDVDLGLATVAANVGEETWVGTARGDRISRLPACK